MKTVKLDITGYFKLQFGMIIGYLKFSLSFHLCSVVVVLFFVLFGARDYKKMIFSDRSPVYMGYTAGHELGTLSIRICNSLTVYDNSWVLKFDIFSEFRKVISDSPPPISVIMTHCVRKSIFYSPLRHRFVLSAS